MSTVEIGTPDAPAWLNENGRELWISDLAFRCNAANAQTEAEKDAVNREADQCLEDPMLLQVIADWASRGGWRITQNGRARHWCKSRH